MNYIIRFLKSPYMIVLNLLGALLIAALLDYFKTVSNPLHVFIGFATIIGLIALNMFFVALLNRFRTEEELDEKITDMRNILSQNHLNWMVNQRYLAMAEDVSEETWVFAPELTYAIQPESEIFKAIDKNLKRGAKYKFFMPNRPRVHKIISDYKRLHSYAEGQVQFFLVPPDEYYFHTIISIYDVFNAQPKAIEFLPINNLEVWVEMDKEHTNRIIGIGEILMKKHFITHKELTEKTVQNQGVVKE